MDTQNRRKNIPQSDAIWISSEKDGSKYNRSSKNTTFLNSFDSGFGGDLGGGPGAHSYGSHTGNMSPSDYKRSLSTQSYSGRTESFDHDQKSSTGLGGNRRRTMTVANDDRDGPFGTSPFSSSSKNDNRSPFQRSNSISFGTEPNFGGIIKRSIGTLFNAATVNTSLATATIQKSVPKVKCVSSMDQCAIGRRNSHDRNDHLTDHMVSYLCESAIR